jgi:hypothetical protein
MVAEISWYWNYEVLKLLEPVIEEISTILPNSIKMIQLDN